MKRVFDFWVALCLLALLAPLLGLFLVIIWLQDRHSPFFWGERVGLNGQRFWMLKLRTMFWHADQSLSITPQNDARITPFGSFLRSFKLDELTQLWNVLKGDMSLVGPRPDVYAGGVILYTQEEQIILTVKPGIVDLSSLLFFNEGKVLARFQEPEKAYYESLFPLKKKLMVFYVTQKSFALDLQILLGVALLPFSRAGALSLVRHLLKRYAAPEDLIHNCEAVVGPL